MLNPWTDKNVEILKAKYAEGLSSSQIARVINTRAGFHLVSRNSVIGKLHRLGLVDPNRNPSKPRSKSDGTDANQVRRRPSLVLEEPVIEEPALVLEGGKHVTILTVNDTTCRWPIGDPQSEDFHFCGHAPKGGSPYCEAHSRKAFQPRAAAQKAA